MNYRHIYHAGNFADIIKHLTLIVVINKLKQKEKPFTVLDCFAGVGEYDISSTPALKTAESLTGIKKIQAIDSLINKPKLLEIFLNILNNQPNSNIYPGSPLIIRTLLREDDKLIACELHPDDYLILRKKFHKDFKVSVHHKDAYLAIKAFLPFKTRRGLIFLDPPFEKKDEFNKLLISLNIIKKRAENISTIIWHPIKESKLINDFFQNYNMIGFKETLKIEFELLSAELNMSKCGLLIINPPEIKTEIALNLEFLVKNVFNSKARYYINDELIK